jgi:aminopeptidase C
MMLKVADIKKYADELVAQVETISKTALPEKQASEAVTKYKSVLAEELRKHAEELRTKVSSEVDFSYADVMAYANSIEGK